jgi:hypothetical protein
LKSWNGIAILRSAPSFLEAARCKGAEAAMLQAFTQPVVSGFAALDVPILESTTLAFIDLTPYASPTGAALDKVPIA